VTSHFVLHFVLHLHAVHGRNGAVRLTSAWIELPLVKVVSEKGNAGIVSADVRLHELVTVAIGPVGGNRVLAGIVGMLMSVTVIVYSPQQVGAGIVNVTGEGDVEVTVCESTVPCGVVREIITDSPTGIALDTIGIIKVVVQFAEEHFGAQSGLHFVWTLHLQFASRLLLLLLLCLCFAMRSFLIL
jgi:hypothetical protein